MHSQRSKSYYRHHLHSEPEYTLLYLERLAWPATSAFYSSCVTSYVAFPLLFSSRYSRLSSRNTKIPFENIHPRGATRTRANRCADDGLRVPAPSADDGLAATPVEQQRKQRMRTLGEPVNVPSRRADDEPEYVQPTIVSTLAVQNYVRPYVLAATDPRARS